MVTFSLRLLLSTPTRGLGLVLTAKTATFLVAVLAIYYPDLQIIFLNAIRNEATNQIHPVVPILAYIMYRKRRILREQMSAEQSNWSRTSQHFTTLIGTLSFTAAITDGFCQ